MRQPLLEPLWEGGHVFAWILKPNKKAIKNSGAHFGVVISFKTTAIFVADLGVQDSYAKKYKPVVTLIPGAISVWDVKIVG